MRKIPSGKEYTGPKAVNTGTLTEIQKNAEQLNMKGVYDALIKFNTINFSTLDEKVNTIEMMALYQQAFTLLGTPLKVDGFFGRATCIAVKKFQESNELVGDGIPGQKTTEILLKKLSEGIEKEEKKGQYTIQEARDTLQITEKDKENITRILKEARKSSLPGSNQYSSYAGVNWNNIDYAYVKQSDGGYYFFDKPSEDTPIKRNVYVTDKDFNVLGVAQVEGGGKMLAIKGKSFTAPFDPIPKFTRK